MSVIAEYSVSKGRLALEQTLGEHPDVRVDLERAFATDPSEPIFFVWVTAPDLDAFEAAMRADPTVTDVERLSEVDGRRLYRFQVTPEAEVVPYPEWVELGAERLEGHYQDGRWHVQTRFPDREALAEYRSFLEEAGMDFRLDRLYGSDRAGEDALSLTPQQLETLSLAYEKGFFDIPRQVTTTDLAAELGVSNQAVSERLRRGYARLVEQSLF